MTDVRNRKFRLIETRAVGPHGKIVTGWYSAPLGMDYDEYRAIDENLVRLYGSEGSRTIGTFLDAPTETHSRGL